VSVNEHPPVAAPASIRPGERSDDSPALINCHSLHSPEMLNVHEAIVVKNESGHIIAE
jgi:hypothetical protein